MPTSPPPPPDAGASAGILYIDVPSAEDAERLPGDPMEALDRLTQLNGPDPHRAAHLCGAATLVAAMLAVKGYAGLASLAESLRGELSDETFAELLGHAEAVIAGGEGATYRALAAYADVLQRRYRGFDGGMAYDKLLSLMGVAGFRPPRVLNDDSIAGTIRSVGQCWPAKIVIGGGGGESREGGEQASGGSGREGDHWILVGKDARGLFIYDPYPREDASQITRPGESDWEKYAAAIGEDEEGRNTIGFLPRG
jgi:hypothetical protein